MTYTALITGADKGLGQSLTENFLAEGFTVFAGIYLHDGKLLPAKAQYPQALTIVPLDVTDLGSIRHAEELISRKTEALDVLVNNAGVHLPGSKVSLEELDIPGRILEKVMDVNAFGPLRVVQQFLPMMRKGQLKRIINISSEAGSISNCERESWFPYCMSKAALNMQTHILNNYLAKEGFRVMAIHPGWMRTDMGGPDGDIHPDEAAAGIFRLALMEWKADDPIYMDYLGEAMAW